MPNQLTRRHLLATVPALAALRILPAAAAPAFGPPQPFSEDWLRERARALAAQAYAPPPSTHHDVLETVTYDLHRQITFRPERALWADGGGSFPVEFFHQGRYFKDPVAIHVVDGDVARELHYEPAFFNFGESGLAATLPADLGFAGFRLMHPGAKPGDWLVFLGAAYFRSAGELEQYGLSARGVAVNTGLPVPEEFPRFTAFWLQDSDPSDESVVIHALLDGPSVTGAYRFDVTRGTAPTMEVRCDLYLRADVERLGVAPLTSMFWYAENNRRRADDWRPEIHDSDGLALWTGGGERLWRPLGNPNLLMVNSFLDRNPKGFGLLQRDRDFSHYEDDGARYHLRPSLWVEPLGEWGAGAVQLVEIPTDEEILDNVVAFWVDERPATAGAERSYRYRLHWVGDEPYPPSIGIVLHTRTGRAGIPGQEPVPNGRKFVIDFAGGLLPVLSPRAEVAVMAEASRGEITSTGATWVEGTDRWRAFIDLVAAGPEPVDLRCYLRLDDRALTETWLYQYFPDDP